MLYRLRESSPDALREGLQTVKLADVVGVTAVSTLEIERGDWVVLGSHEPSKRAFLRALPMDDESSFTGEVVEQFLEAYHSLRAWNDFPMAPEWFREILLPRLKPPSQDGVPAPTSLATVEEKPAAKGKPRPPPAGPAQVHVTITYEGQGLPNVALLRKRRSVEEWIEREGLGEVTDAGGGGGVMDIFVDTANAREAVAALTAKLVQMGWSSHTKIEVEPLDEAN